MGESMTKQDIQVSRRTFLTGVAALGASVAAASTAGHSSSAWADDMPERPFIETIQSETWSHGDVVDADLVIVGSGMAGLWAALTAAEAGVGRIAVIDKGAIGFSSISSLIAGSSVYVLPGEDVHSVMQELVKGSGYLSRQDYWEDMLGASAELYDDMTNKIGVEYKGKRFSSDGNIYTKLSSGANWNGIATGRGIVCGLIEQLRKYDNVGYFSKTMVTEILKDGDKAAGVIGVNRMTGDALAIKAKAVILATGQCSFQGQHALQEVNTGDGYSLAYHAGATLNNMEFWAFDIDPKHYGFEGGSLLGARGARMINRNNEEFMWEVDPVNGSDADVRYTTRAMAQEVDKGRGPIFLDRTTYQFALLGQFGWKASLPPHSWRRINDDRMPEVGHNPLLEPEEYVATSFGIIGAIKADENLCTSVPGLYVSSVALSADPGKTKGIESARAMWSGRKAAKAAAEYVTTCADVALPDEYIAERVEMAVQPLANSTVDPTLAMTPNEIIRALHEVIFDYHVCLLPRESTLVSALSQVRSLKEMAADTMSATDPHELAKYYEAQHLLELAELHLMASLERKETRVCHYREDYPEMDNENWLKWITFTCGADGQPVMAFEDVPIENYPLQPGKEA